jgi:hypothetical protein
MVFENIADWRFRRWSNQSRNSSPEFRSSSLHPEIYTARPTISINPAIFTPATILLGCSIFALLNIAGIFG